MSRRLEFNNEVVTGYMDWFKPADSNEIGEDWNPAKGGSLQELKLREAFRDHSPHDRGIQNHSPYFWVLDIQKTSFGDLDVSFTGGFRLRVFPSGCYGEFWRIFEKDNLKSDYVCEGSIQPKN